MRVVHVSRRACSLLAATILPSLVLCQHLPSINVALKTSFDAGPYLIELLETAALENATSYFPLLDRVADGTFADLRTDKDLYEKFVAVLEQEGHLRDPEALSSFKYALALHAAAPRVEAHYQYYKTAVEPHMMAAQDAACPVWVHMDGQQYCSSGLERAQQPLDVTDADLELPFDRSLGRGLDIPVSVLYADITHPLFGQFHEIVSRTAREGKSIYRVRYRPSGGTQRPLYIGGYGTELVLKRTDYIVIDDRDAARINDAGEADTNTDAKAADLKPLTTSELSSLGLNTASYIMSSANPFDTLMDVSSNFPKFSSVVSQHNTSHELVAELLANRQFLLPTGANVMWMNGLQMDHRNTDAYSLLDALRRERRLIGQLRDIGLTSTQAVDILSHEVLTQALSDDQPQRYDWRDDEEDNSAIIWMNNIEEDSRYHGWSPSLRMLLQRTYPGQLPQVRRNIHNLIVAVDLGDAEDLDLVVNTLQIMVKRMLPIRIGLVPTTASATAKTGAQLSYHIIKYYGLAVLTKFYQTLMESKPDSNVQQQIFEKLIGEHETREDLNSLGFADVLSSEDVRLHISAAEVYCRRLALTDPELSVNINGIIVPRSDTWFEQVSQRLSLDLRNLQIDVYEERVTEDMNIVDVFLSNARSKRNTLIVPSDPRNVTVFNVADLVNKHESSFARLPRVAGGESSLLSERSHILVVANLDDETGRKLAAAASDFQSRHPEAEILYLHNSADLEGDDSVSTKLFVETEEKAHSISLDALRQIIAVEASMGDWTDLQKEAAVEFWAAQKPLLSDLGFRSGEQGLWVNGRVLGPITTNFDIDDFEALVEIETLTRIAPVTTAVTGLALEDKFKTPLALSKLTSIVALSLKSDVPQGIYEAPPPIRINKFKRWSGQYTSIHAQSTEEPTIQIVAAIDPASEVAQPWIPILRTLSELKGVDVKIYLNPQNKLEELPVKRFYRHIVRSAPKFDESGMLTTPRASFKGVPKETLFNLGLVVPPPWLVAPKESVYDLDNIKLSSVSPGSNVDAIYELEHILIEGHSRDSNKGTPPRGVQLLLGSEQNKHFTDTIIMSNLGYFQFKANPGFWQISLEPGRSSKLFNIDSVGAKGYAPRPGDETSSVALLSFQGVTLFPRLSRKSGMENEDVLEATASGSTMNYLGKGASFASSALSSLGLKKGKSVANAEINIFSVASGHLYERMLNIMMVSVMRHTKHTVKFWFIEQFLSPSFKSALPVLATHYGFDYEMVTYKWPHWLRGQKEKQREIWGYKILFLDVLFPLNLDKVIFVDADQIVRTDMMELNKVDLKGAPYGFTPMCDSRTEMEGFRFWKQGYWKNYLAGKPYHISALYVVDLKAFRQVAAGDRLRQQYHALSADPASLSNLDQDLPNHMQPVLPIHSLPQEWLWCETWCSDESLKDAKTIDLCNNPQTKEPKLDRARRQVPEWTEYDDEIADVLRKAKGEDSLVRGGVQENEQRVLQDESARKKDEL